MYRITSVLALLLISISLTGCFPQWKITLNASEADAKIFVNGQLMGNGTVEARIPLGDEISVRAEKEGFVTYKNKFYYDTYKPKYRTAELLLERDGSFTASEQSNTANVDFTQVVNSKYNEEEAWKLLNRIVTGYFDEIEVSDKSTGYLKTGWVINNFNTSTVRSRIIVKGAGNNPLTYKLKLVSEIAYSPNVSATQDEKFQPWDRIMKKYQDLVSEYQSRLAQ
jgi:hypothetical protein